MRKAIIGGFVGLISGGVIGFYFGKFVSKKTYEKIADDEIAAVKKVYEEHYILKGKKITKNEPDDISKKTSNGYQEPKSENKSAIPHAYSDYFKHAGKYDGNAPRKGGMDVPEIKPYVISPDDFGDSEYETQTLIYWADMVLTDDDHNIVNDIEGHVTSEALTTFGRYEDDCVYVRNDILHVDYEILLEEREFNKVSPRSLVEHPEEE